MDGELIAAACDGDVLKLRELIGKGANIEATDDVRELGCIALNVVASCLTGLCAVWMDAAPFCS
jgi:hypothetical protein